MYKYKPVRYIFRLLNLIIYAAVISFSVIAIRDDLRITDFMAAVFKDNLMDSKRSLYLTIFLLVNVCIILLFKVLSKEKTKALFYYICDFIIRLTFSVPLAFITLYFLFYRLMPNLLFDAMTQIIVFLILFAVYDYLMRWQIMFRLDVSYFRVKDKL